MRKDDNAATGNDDSFCRTEAICQGFRWRRSEKERADLTKKHSTNATGDMKLRITFYVGLQHVKRELVRPYTLQISRLFRALSLSLSLFPSLYAARPHSDSVVATGGCTGVSCQRHHLHRFVPFVLK